MMLRVRMARSVIDLGNGERSEAKLKHFQTSDHERIAYCIDDFSDPWAPAPTVLMLHSLMGHSGRFHAMVPALARYFRVVRMDMRGHGGSTVPDRTKPLTLERMTQDVRELLDHLELDGAHVIGNSAGGYLSQTLAIESPERVTSLSLFGSTPGLSRSGAAKWLPQIAEKGLRPFLAETISDRFPVEQEKHEKIEWFLDECAKNDTGFITAALELFTSLDWSDKLSGIRCPTLIVAAGGETVGSADHYTDMKQRILDSTLIYYQDMPHNICDIQPDRCSDDVLHFLRWNFPALDHIR